MHHVLSDVAIVQTLSVHKNVTLWLFYILFFIYLILLILRSIFFCFLASISVSSGAGAKSHGEITLLHAIMNALPGARSNSSHM